MWKISFKTFGGIWHVLIHYKCHYKFFKGCLPQILIGTFLNTLSHSSLWYHKVRMLLLKESWLTQFFSTKSQEFPVALSDPLYLTVVNSSLVFVCQDHSQFQTVRNVSFSHCFGGKMLTIQLFVSGNQVVFNWKCKHSWTDNSRDELGGWSKVSNFIDS